MYKYLLSAAVSLFCQLAVSQNYHYIRTEGGNPVNQATQTVLNNTDDALDESNGNWNLLEDSIFGYTSAMSLPFPFNFYGTPVTSFIAHQAGFITFTTSASIAVSSVPSVLPTSRLPDNSIAVWGLDGSGKNDKVVTRVFGAAPNRQFWIKFSSFSTPSDTAESFNYFSIVLEESSQKVFVVGMYFNQAFGEYKPPTLSIGLQQNSTDGFSVLGSPNIKPRANNKTPVDNICYEFIPGSDLSENAEITNITYNEVLKTGDALVRKIRLRQIGSKQLDSITLSYSINNGSVVQNRLKDLNILPYGEKDSVITLNLLPTAGTAGTIYNTKIWISQPNDGVELSTTNDTLNVVNVVVNGVGASKKVLIEAGTATWCGDCAPIQLKWESLKSRYGDTLLWVQHHTLDGMSGNGDSLNQQFLGVLPQALVNRSNFNGGKGVDIDSVLKVIEREKLAYTPVQIRISNYSLNDVTGVVSFTVVAKFNDYFFGNISLGGIVTENKVRGSTPDFNQTVYGKYTSDANNWYYKFVSPIVGYYHQNVAWHVAGGVFGQSKGMDKVYNPGDSMMATFTYKLPKLLYVVNIPSSPFMPVGDVVGMGKPADLGLVAFVTNKNGGEILNSASRPLWDTTMQQHTISQLQNASVYPNPSSDEFFVGLPVGDYNYTLFQADGKQVGQGSTNGEGQLRLNMVDLGLANGMYILQVTNGKGEMASLRLLYLR